MGKQDTSEAVSPVVALFGDAKVEVKSRAGGPEFSGPITDFHPTALVVIVKAGVADLMNGVAMATLTKPGKDDFTSQDELDTALAEYKVEVAARKTAMWNGFHTGTIPTFPAKTWQSPVRAEIDRIVHADLTSFFAGQPVRFSTPTAVYALPAKTSEAYKGFAAKWLKKYSAEITAEAEDNVASGKIATATAVPVASADLEF